MVVQIYSPKQKISIQPLHTSVSPLRTSVLKINLATKEAVRQLAKLAARLA